MAFWGVEIKPGKPFTHTYDSSKGRLHISMATLGNGTAITKSTLQCNVGNKSPVYLCALYPGKTESLQLNLELEEDGNVILSVLGPRSIHLCGYYLARGRYGNTMDESESYGEDIADTETEKTDHSDEDDYEDSFIDDDGDLAVFPPSPISNEEDASYDSGRKSAKGSRRRLRKKYQLVESDDDGGLEEKKIVKDNVHVQSQEIDDEDSLPISTFYKNKASRRVLDQEMDDNVDKEAVDAGKKDGEDRENSTIETKLKTDNVVADSQTHREAEPSDQLEIPCTVLDVGDKKPKKKKKGKEKETKSSSTELDNAAQDEPKMNMSQDLLDQEMVDNVDKEAVDDGKKDSEDRENSTIEAKLKTENVVADIQTHGEAEPSDHLAVPCTVPDVGDIKKSKKKKKGKEKETKSSCNDHSTELDNAAQDEPERNTAQDLLAGNEQLQQQADDMKAETTDKILPFSQAGQGQDEKPKRKRKERSKEETRITADDACISNVVIPPKENEHNNQDTVNGVDNGAQDNPDGNQSEDKKVKKKKKKSKSQGSEVVSSDMPVSDGQSTEIMKVDGNNTEDTKSSQVRTLSNGLVIQELETGKENGKIAAPGKKISINYTGKLKENGVVVESNAGEAPFKFRLGKGEVIESWDIGLEGMRVGEKRRLVVPPSMTSKKDSDSENIPPNSWLVYDFELVKVH